MESNNNNALSSPSSSQWSIFCSQHCRIWFGSVKEFDSESRCLDEFRVMHSFKPKLNDQTQIEHSNVYYFDDDRGTVTSSKLTNSWETWHWSYVHELTLQVPNAAPGSTKSKNAPAKISKESNTPSGLTPNTYSSRPVSELSFLSAFIICKIEICLLKDLAFCSTTQL